MNLDILHAQPCFAVNDYTRIFTRFSVAKKHFLKSMSENMFYYIKLIEVKNNINNF